MSKRTRSGGRAGNQRRTSKSVIEQLPWRLVKNTDRPIEALDEDGVQNIHNGVCEILETIGIQFQHPEACKILKAGGATVDGENVRIDREMLMEYIGYAPSQFTITPRNPDREIIMGGSYITFGNVGSPPNVWDKERGKRAGDFESYIELVKMTQYFNCLHVNTGYPVEPIDVHASIRHLDCLYEKLVLSDKVIHAYSLGTERIEDGMEMVRIASGISHDEFDEKPRMFTNINSVSPLKHDHPMLDGLMRMSKRGQPTVVTPFTLAGAMAPVTMAGAVTLSLAEGLAAIVLIQMIRKGCPCMIGTFTSNVDMKSGAPAFGTPEYIRATQITGQMARFYGLAMRSSGACAANVPDGQAMWETTASLWAAVQSRTNLVYHSAGWLEGGLIASPAKFVMDCEVLQQFERYFEDSYMQTTPADIALDAIKDVGWKPGANYFSTQHTQDRYANAFYAPFLSDWTNYEAWVEQGATWTADRAHTLYKEIIGGFEAPAIDVAIRDELADFVARRKSEGGAPTDF